MGLAVAATTFVSSGVAAPPRWRSIADMLAQGCDKLSVSRPLSPELRS
jgi:hypothetical protein